MVSLLFGPATGSYNTAEALKPVYEKGETCPVIWFTKSTSVFGNW